MKTTDISNTQFFASSVLRGISQIMLQGKLRTGVLFLAGLFISGNFLFGIAALFAATIGTVTALLFSVDKENISNGLYGFSPALTGVALILLFENSLLTWLFIFIGSVAAALIQHLFIRNKIPAYTFPFILITWVLVFIIRENFLIAPADATSSTDYLNSFSLNASFRGYGQVIFQSNVFSGILFFVGVFISSRTAAIYGLGASLTGALCALALGFSLETAELGIFGFNPVLTAIVFSGNKKSDAVWVSIGVLLTIAIHLFLLKTGITERFGGVLTFPFVAGTWSTLLIKKFISARKSR